MTLGRITLRMRLWCRRLYRGAVWYRTKEYSYATYCTKFRTPHYALVEQMRDCGLIIFVRGTARDGHYWEAQLTALGIEIGKKPPNSKMMKLMIEGEEREQ